MSGRTAGRVSGYPVWQQTPVSSRSVARRVRERGKERARGRGREEGRYERSFVSVAARTGNTKYGRHLVFSFGHERAFEIYFFHGKSKFLCSSGRRALVQTPRLDPTAGASLFRRGLRAQFEHVVRATSESSFFARDTCALDTLEKCKLKLIAFV